MNIFILDTDPIKAAQYQCNKHVVKMIVESAQMLSTAYRDVIAPYRHTHVNHPCSLWARWSFQNFVWLVAHAKELCSEYTKRYKKVHKTEAIIDWFIANPPNLPDRGLTPFVIAIKDQKYHLTDAVSSYRAYYIGDKARFAKWSPKAAPPSWWPNQNA